MSNIAVFGADGFIGKHLTKALAANSDNTVFAFDRFSTYKNAEDHDFSEHSNIEVVIGDFFNRNDVSNCLKNVDYVFHLVSTTNPAASNLDPNIDVETNIKGSVEFFDLCVENNIKKVIFLSSGGTVYGEVDSDLINENYVPEPRSPYGIGKLTIEHYLRYFKHTHDLDYIIYRLANPYGPGQNIHGRQGVIPIFMNKTLHSEPVTIYGDGNMIRDYIYIDDAIDMIVGSYLQPSKYSTYNVGSGKGSSINNLVDGIESCIGRKITKTHIDIPSTYVAKSVLDISRFTEEFKIQPKTSLSDGLAKTWKYVNELS